MLKPPMARADWHSVRRFSLLAAALAALALPGAAGAGLGVGVTDDLGRDSPDGGAAFVAMLGDLGFTENRVSVVLGPGQPRRDPAAGRARPLRADGYGRRHPRRARRLSRPPDRGRRQPGSRRPVRGVPRRACAHLSPGHRLRRRQRAEPAAVLAAAVHDGGHAGRLRLVRAAARGLLRRAEGGQPGDHRRRAGPLAARQRQPDCSGQPVDIARALPPRPGGGVPGERADAPDHGRARLPRVPGARRAAIRRPVLLAEGRARRPRAYQAGGVGRVQRHGAGDLRGAEPLGRCCPR